MEFILTCLSSINIVFLMVLLFVTLFFRLERAVVHQVITITVITVVHVLEVILKIISNQSFWFPIALSLLWGFNLYTSVRRLKSVKKEIEEEEKKNQL